jgi:hypothetical protein
MSELPTDPRTCPAYAHCAASLCPLDPGLDQRTWFPPERVCSRQWVGAAPPWLLKQRKIAHRCRATGTCFTRAMIAAVSIVGRAISGLDPESSTPVDDEAAWIAQKLKGALSPEARARQAERARRLRMLRSVKAVSSSRESQGPKDTNPDP